MSNRTINLTRRRLLGGIATFGAGSAAAGAGTVAMFSDSESSTGNDVVTGTLELTLDGSNGTVQFLSETDVAPDDSGQETLTLANTGSLPGYVDVEVASMVSYENGFAGQENGIDNSGGDPGAGAGELDEYLEIQAGFQNGPSLWGGWDTVANRLTTGTVYDVDYELPPGGTDQFVLVWRLPDSAGNDAQSDGIEFALTFSLDQQPDGGA